VKNDIAYVNYIDSTNDINNIENKILIKSLSKYNTGDYNSQTNCMKKLNDIQIEPDKKLELIAIGGSNHKILILDVLKFNIYQIINEHKSAVYSLAQYKEDSHYLFSSSGDSTVNIYKLNDNYKYELIQKLRKSEKKYGGEMNKVIVLSNKLLVTGDHRTITIWKAKTKHGNKNHYKLNHEIILNRDTHHLLEVNPTTFIATQYSHGGHFQIYKNDGNLFPLIGELISIRCHGSSSNGLAKINDKLVCSASDNNLLYIICIEPIQIIQKIQMDWEKYTTIFYCYVTSDNYLYFKGEYQSIVQFKIITDEDNNFIELVNIGTYNDNIYFNNYEKAILPFDDGRIFFVEEKVGQICYNLIA
jgi:WD40 repeat protein